MDAWTDRALDDLRDALGDPARRERALAVLATWVESGVDPLPVVSADGSWFRVPGHPTVRLDRRLVLRRLLAALVAADGPRAPRALFAAAWPRERALPGAARNRLHVALSKLRELGLRDHLLWDGAGYRLRARATRDPLTPAAGEPAAPAPPPGR